MMHASKWDRFKVPEDVSFSREDIAALESRAQPVSSVFDQVIAIDPEVVLIGEGSHGTHEHYKNRIELTKSLVEAGRCQAILIEGDLPDTSDLHRFVMGHPSAPESLDESFFGFERFPSWMWANEEMRAFVGWLALHNLKLPPDQRCGIWGLDIYSMHLSMRRVVEYLNDHGTELAAVVQEDYSCFGEIEPQTYGLLAERGLIQGCHLAAADALKRIASKREACAKASSKGTEVEQGFEHGLTLQSTAKLDPIFAQDDAFLAEMNAQVVLGAEEYYRAMFDPTSNSWNLRDSHFFKTLQAVRHHIGATRDGEARVCAWAHNSHLGDARATHLERVSNRDLNLGQLVREQIPFPQSVSVGQFCWTGHVCAASDWGGKHEFKAINEALPNSHEDLLHALARRSKAATFVLNLHDPLVATTLKEPRLQRAIGVIYRPDTERLSHYYRCNLVEQFDLIIFDDVTTPVTPLVKKEAPSKEPETYPTGL